MIGLYMGSTLIGRCEDWKTARTYVRAMAHNDGVGGGEGWGRSKGRSWYEAGIFRAVSTYRS